MDQLNISANDSAMSDSLDYCEELVRTQDRDRYWCAMLAPPSVRAYLMTVYAFNCEIAEIGFSVSEPLIGQMRLRWWLDALTPIYEGNPPKHPVAIALAELVSQRPLRRSLIEHYLETRERDMDPTPFENTFDFTSYAEGTSSALMSMSMDLIAPVSTPTEKLAHSTGVAWAYLGLIRSIPHQLQKGRILLPLDLCDLHNFDRQAMLDHGYKEKSTDGLTDVVSALVNKVVETSKIRETYLPTNGYTYASPLLIRVLISGYLDELASVGNDPFRLQTWRKGPRIRDMIKLKWASTLKKA